MTLFAQATTSATMATTFQWYNAIPWLIGALGLYLGWNSYRRSNLPLIEVTNIQIYGLANAGDAVMEHFLSVDLFSHGADIYDVNVILEAQYTPPDKNGSSLTAKLSFEPETIIPMPFKKGQHIHFVLSHKKLREYPFNPADRSQCLTLNTKNYSGVSISVFSAGKRLIKRIPASVFKRQVEIFDNPPFVTIEGNTIHLQTNGAAERLRLRK